MSGIYHPQVFSLDGRIGRCRYLAYAFAINLILMGTMILVMALLAFVSPELSRIGLVFYIPMLVYAFVLAKRRLNDMEQASWLAVFALIPLVNFFFMLWLIIPPGTPGTNKYGPAPAANTKWVIAGASAVPVFFVVGMLAAIAIPGYADYVKKAKAAQEAQLMQPKN